MADQPQGPQDKPPAGAQTVPEDAQQEFDRRQEAILEKLLDAASKDPGFKDKYMKNPEATLQELGIAEEVEQVESERPVLTGDVAGQSAWYSWWYRHRHYTYRRHWHHLL
jgi:uncharacterized membrane protein YebE (DUF533 family)